jgi:hypothetical protein
MSDKVATKDPPHSEEWIVQLSWKLGQHMLNLRGHSIEGFEEDLDKLMARSEKIGMALSFIEFEPPAQTYTQPPQQFQPPLAQAAPKPGEQEIGPIVVTSIEEKQGVSGPQSKNPGRPFTKYVVVFGGGAIKAATFDTLIVGAAKNLLGAQAYARVVDKGKWGYDLVNVRPAA